MSSGNTPPSLGQFNGPWPAYQIQADGDVYDPPPSQGSMVNDQGQSYNQFQDRGLGQTHVVVEDTKAPSLTAFIPDENSYNDDVNRELGNSYGGQALSIGAMARADVSLNSGSSGVDHYGGEKAPNLSDVNRRGSSQNAPETVFEVPDAQELVGMSLVGKNFRKFYPSAFYKEKNGEN